MTIPHRVAPRAHPYVVIDQESEQARDVLTTALEGEPLTIVDLLGTDDGANIKFEPERLGLTARSAEV